MKRWVVVVLVLLAVVVLVSPGIVGRLAERNIEESLSWADLESDDVAVTEKAFDRAWFTSEGRYRIEFSNSDLQELVGKLLGSGADRPIAVVVDTHIDHGLVPVTSMSRESGNLRPALASAVSTLQLDLGDGELIAIPGKLYSRVGLSGATVSRFILEAGAFDADEMQAEWSGADVTFTTDAAGRSLQYEGTVEPLSIDPRSGPGDTAPPEVETMKVGAIEVGTMKFTGHLEPGGYGFNVGQYAMDVASFRATVPGGAIGFGELSLESASGIDDGRVHGELTINVSDAVTQQRGTFDMALDVAVQGLDAPSMQSIVAALETAQAADDADTALANIYPQIENDIKSLLAAGAEVHVEQLDVTLPQGTVASALHVDLPEAGTAGDFSWPSVLLRLTASAKVRVPAALVDMAQAANPRAGALIAMGFLERDGEFYLMDAEYAKGLLTVNGAPMPIPMPAPMQ